MPLTDRQIRNISPSEKPSKLADEKGLFLLINPNGARYWRLKYRIAGKEKLLSLGVYPETSLSEARSQRDEARKLIAQGVDPSEQRKNSKQAAAAENSFESVAREWHKKNASKWSTDHAIRILQRIEADIFPEIGQVDIATLKTRDLLAPLRKVEERGALDLASRLRQHIHGIMRYAVQIGLVEANPASDITGALATRKATHRPALPLEKIPDLLKRIELDNGRLLTKLALQFTLLTFVRSSEIRFMRWDEIDSARETWIIPASRTEIEGVKHSHRGAKMNRPGFTRHSGAARNTAFHTLPATARY
jgi:integrase